MGCGSSTQSAAVQTGGAPSSRSNRASKPKPPLEKLKFILVGAGESGKSTIFKQMRIQYGGGYNEEDLEMYVVVIRSNIVTAMAKMCQLLEALELEEQLEEEPAAEGAQMTPKEAYDLLAPRMLKPNGTFDASLAGAFGKDEPEENLNGLDDDAEESAGGGCPKLSEGTNRNAVYFLKQWRAIKILWESETMQEIWPKRALYNVIDSHKHYFSDIERIASPGFRPKTQDVLYSRIKSTRVTTENYVFDGKEFEVYDVGGQRGYRKHWMDHFQEVDGVICVAALSEYDQVLHETKFNRMSESINIFKSICGHEAFNDKPIILFLNKEDVFKEKIKYSDINSCQQFRDYDGPPKDHKQGVSYFMKKFRDCCLPGQSIDVFPTTATDVKNMKFFLDSTNGILMRSKLKDVGLL